VSLVINKQSKVWGGFEKYDDAARYALYKIAMTMLDWQIPWRGPEPKLP